MVAQTCFCPLHDFPGNFAETNCECYSDTPIDNNFPWSTLLQKRRQNQCSELCSETTRLRLLVSLGSTWVLNIMTSFLFMVYESVDVEKWSCVC